MGSLLDRIKEDAKKASASKRKFVYFKEGEKKRIRFLNDMNDGFEVTFHDSFSAGINVPCQEIFGRNCPYCGEEGLRTRSQYAWSVWDVEAEEVKIFMFPMNNCSPIPPIAAMYEEYGTLTDREYTISVTGKQQNKSFTVVPQNKMKFRNAQAKPFSHSAFLKELDKAYPDEHADLAEDTKSKNDEEEELDYSEMSPRELYDLCEDRGIEAEPKMKAKYYINLLEEYDEEHEDDSDEDEEVDYSEMSAKELYNLCKEKGIDVEPKKSEKYYINLLKENEKAHDDWDEEEDSDEEDDW